ncbi:unnamed protein product [Rotaria sp. Silwood1]|nr:unnamed protein product [Rotaria sp. Silwood1]
MSKKEKKSRQLVHNSETTASVQETDIEIKSTSSSIIKGVCDDNLLNGTCENLNCNQLHLTESIQLTDGHFHDRLLKENWSCAIEPLKNIEQFIGITNIHKSSMWNNTLSIVPECLNSKIRLYESYGIHPRYLDDDPYNDLLNLRNLIQTRSMIAVGECGLDLLNNEQLSLQTEIFVSQIKLANEFHLPLIIHCRQLDQQLFDILKKYALDSSMKIQWHCCHSKGELIYRYTHPAHFFFVSLFFAVGECGLDLLNNEQLLLQTEIFVSQIKLANEFHLPLIIHCRQLDQQLFDILKKYALDSSMKIQWHCCHSKGELIYREFLNYFPSSLLSIGGMCCHTNEKNIQKLIRELYELENNTNQRRFVFETDSPYLKSSSLLINTEDNCPILGTLTVSAYITKNILKNNQWTNNLKINTTILQKFFNLT